MDFTHFPLKITSNSSKTSLFCRELQYFKFSAPLIVIVQPDQAQKSVMRPAPQKLWTPLI